MRFARIPPLMAALCVVYPAAAAPDTSQEAPEATRKPRIESIVVIGEPQDAEPASLAGSLDVLGRDEIQYEHVDDTMELFSKVPGVYLSRFNQGIINTELSIRGFAGDGETPHAKLLIDGTPSNLHNGYTEMDQLFPLNIDAIQVFKGTSDVRHGLFNLAGNYELTTRSDPATEIELTLGSFGEREAQGYFGFESGRLRHSYFLGYRESDGYRDHTDLRKRAASGRWFYDLDDATTVGLIVRAADYGGDAPGYLSRSVRRSRPTSSADFANQDGGEKDTRHYSLHLERALGATADLTLRAYHQRFENVRFVRFSEAGSLQNRIGDQKQDGVRAAFAWRPAETWTLSLGADYEAQDNLEQRFGTVGQGRQRDPNNVIRDFDYELRTAGGYASLEHAPNAIVRWNAGLRLDRLDGDFSSRDADGSRTDADIFDFGTIVQPKANLFVSPVEQITFFASYGRSFQHPFGSSLYTSGPDDARDVSLNDGWEAGIKWSPIDTLELRASYWEQNASDEFVLLDGVSRNVGKTERRGIDLAANWYATDSLYVWANLSRIDSEIVRTGDGLEATIGNELRSIPDFTASAGISYAIWPELTLRMHLDAQGDYYVNELNAGGEFGNYTVAHASLAYDMGWGDVTLQVSNLFDRDYEYVFDFSEDGTDTIHSPSDGLGVSLSVSYRMR